MSLVGSVASIALARLLDVVRVPVLLTAAMAQGEGPGDWVRALESENAPAAIEALVKIGAPAVPFLIEGLASDSVRIRVGSARALGRLQAASRPALPALVEALQGAPVQAESALAASEALVQIGRHARSAVADLVACYQDRLRAEEVRLVAAWTLGGLAAVHKDAATGLLPALEDPEPTKVELFVPIALSRGGKGSLSSLKKALDKAAEDNHRLQIVGILNAMAFCGVGSGSPGKKVAPLARDPVLRPGVVHAFDSTGGDRALRKLLEELLHEEIEVDPLYPALFREEHPAEELLQTLQQVFSIEQQAVTGALPTVLRCSRANRNPGAPGLVTMGDALEGLGEHLTRRWSELSARWTQEGLPPLEEVSSELQTFLGTAQLLQASLGDRPYWAGGKSK
jgi:hypothetical protein